MFEVSKIPNAIQEMIRMQICILGVSKMHSRHEESVMLLNIKYVMPTIPLQYIFAESQSWLQITQLNRLETISPSQIDSGSIQFKNVCGQCNAALCPHNIE